MSKKKTLVVRRFPEYKVVSVPCPPGLVECIELYRAAKGLRSAGQAVRKVLGDAMVEQGFAEPLRAEDLDLTPRTAKSKAK